MSSDSQVQGSNDWSIASKLSTVNAGYYKDPFIKCFAEKMTKRSSLIHRGYYERFKAINHIFKEFLKLYPQGQVISFGAGFDSSFFRLRSEGFNQCHFVEIDFPDVVKRKELLIKQHSICTELASDTNIYTLLAGDLRDLSTLNALLLNSNISKTAPTLFFSECAITYMDTNSSDRLIEWCSQNFENAVFSVYEQIEPSDGFGLVMQRHFNQLSIPLLSLESYPDKYSQMERFNTKGWTRCQVYDLNEFSQQSEGFFANCPIWNQEGVHYLEPFDEYEGLHAKCAHYIILAASKGDCATSLTIGPIDPSSAWDKNDADPLLLKKLTECNFRSAYKSCSVDWELNDSTFNVMSDSRSHQQTVRRYGQASCETPDGCLWISGGFGVTDKGEHKRLNDMIVLHPNGVHHKQLELSKSKFDSRMHHSMDFLNGTFVIFGGRTHPKNPLCNLLLYSFETNDCLENLHSFVYDDHSVDYNIHPHPGRYRHASTSIQPSTIFVCGGLFTQGKLLDDCWQLDLSDWFADKTKSPKWFKFASLPTGRHSASLSHWKNQLILYGGLDKWEKVCSPQLLVADSTLGEQSEWKQVCWNGPEPLPRYSHQTLVTKDDRLLLVGGTSSSWPSSLGVCIIQLGNWSCSEYCLPNQEPERPVILVGHSAHLTRNERDELVISCWGGGASCFSFGTHFNTVNVRIFLPRD